MVPSDHPHALHASRLSFARPQSAPTAMHQQASALEDLHMLADETDMPLPSRSQSEEPRQCPSPAQLPSLPDEAFTPLPNRRVAALTGAGLPTTPLNQGTKEYGSWWTPRLPQALTPAWLKSRKSSWLGKVSQLNLSYMVDIGTVPQRIGSYHLQSFRLFSQAFVSGSVISVHQHVVHDCHSMFSISENVVVDRERSLSSLRH